MLVSCNIAVVGGDCAVISRRCVATSARAIAIPSWRRVRCHSRRQLRVTKIDLTRTTRPTRA